MLNIFVAKKMGFKQIFLTLRIFHGCMTHKNDFLDFQEPLKMQFSILNSNLCSIIYMFLR